MSDVLAASGEFDFCQGSESKRSRSMRSAAAPKVRRAHRVWSSLPAESRMELDELRAGGTILRYSASELESGAVWAKAIEQESLGQILVSDPLGQQNKSVRAIQDQLNQNWQNDFQLLLREWQDTAVAEAVETQLNGDVSIMREAGLPGLAIMFCSIPLIALSQGAGIAGMFAGSAVFWLANYSSYRAGQQGWVIGPAGSAKLFAGSVILALTAVVAALTN